MVIKEDGTKWACQSCLKGHRVSGCTHKDRPLVFVPKKGRPVTQCQHCRVERKKRASHVRCDCGEKHHTKDKCVHLKNGDYGHADAQGSDLGPVPEDHELSDINDCCCHHGGKCTCSILKKEPGSDPSECHTNFYAASSRVSKPRLPTNHSDGHVTAFTSGHHKPAIHRVHTSSHESAMPYRIPRANTDHGPLSNDRVPLDTTQGELIDGSFSVLQQRPVSIHGSGANASTAAENGTMPSVGEGFPFNFDQQTATASPANNFFGFTQFENDANGSTEALLGSLPQDFASQALPQSYSDAEWSAPLSTSNSNNLDWNAVDWSQLGESFCNHQPALTYASSNTVSDFGETTPPEELQGLMDTRNNTQPMAALPFDPRSMPAGETFANQTDDNALNRWSLPASFWTSMGTAGSSANASTDSVASHPATFAPSQTPSSSSTENLAAPSYVRRNLTSHAASRARPKTMVHKSNTLPATLTWERLLQQSRTSNLWETDELEESIRPSADVTSAPTNAASLDSGMSQDGFGFDQQTQGLQILSGSQGEQQLYADPQSLDSFDLADGFANNPGFYPQWPQ